MKQVIHDSYKRAGTMKKSGEGLVFEVSGTHCYLMASDVPALLEGQSGSLVNDTGEEEGSAWLSPVREPKKKDLVAALHGRIYVISWREVQRVLNGRIHTAKVQVYLGKEGQGSGALTPELPE